MESNPPCGKNPQGSDQVSSCCFFINSMKIRQVLMSDDSHPWLYNVISRSPYVEWKLVSYAVSRGVYSICKVFGLGCIPEYYHPCTAAI